MDAVGAIQPVTGVAASGNARPVIAVATPSVTPTELPEAKAVNPSPEATPTRTDVRQTGDQSASYITRGFVIDPQSREVIYRVMDTRTRQVLWQVPDQALLSARAYAQTLNGGSAPAPHTNAVDRAG